LNASRKKCERAGTPQHGGLSEGALVNGARIPSQIVKTKVKMRIGFSVLAYLLVVCWLSLAMLISIRLVMPLFETKNNSGDLIRYLDHQNRFMWSKSRNTYLGGGWRSGKSYGGIGFCSVSMNFNPGCAGAILEPDYKMLEDFLENKFKPAFAPYILGEKRTHFLYRIFLKRDITVLGLSGHNLDKLEQFELAWLFADEAGLMKRDLFVRANARVNDPKAGRPRIGYAGTPKIGWMSDVFEGRDDDQRLCIHAKTTSNPYLTQEFVDGLHASCPKRLRAALMDGRFVPGGGVVYPEFDRSRHVIPWKYSEYVRMADGSHSRPVVNIVIDWSPRRPHVLWIQRVPKGAIMPGGWEAKREISVIVDEIYPDGEHQSITVHRLCSMIKRRRPPGYDAPWPVSEAVVDPAGKAEHATSGESEITQAENYLGIPILCRFGERIKVGIQHVQLALDPSVGHPFLLFSSYLDKNPDPTMGHGEINTRRAVLNAIEAYAYKEDRDGRLPDEPHDDDVTTHAMDDMRYHIRYYYPVDIMPIDSWSVA